MKAASRFENIAPYQFSEPLSALAARLGMSAEQIVKLDLNENTFGASPLALKSLANIPLPNLYSDPDCSELRTALADFTGAPADNLLVGNGADDLIDIVMNAMLDPGDAVIICPPCFSMYAFCASVRHGRVIEIPRLPDFSFDLPAIRAAVEKEKPKILFLTSPNNPDGGLIPSEDLDAMLAFPVLVVLDEAYIEFTEDSGRLGCQASCISQVTARENLAVLRTFSKWAGLAGLRIGYGAFPDWLMPTLWNARLPYNVNAAAEAAALASLKDVDILTERVALIQAERRRMFTALSSLPHLSPIPSQTNFLLCQVTGRDAASIQKHLADQGILIRYFGNPPLTDYIRISIGRPQDNNRLLEALEKEL
jgi:histidinol-phosphate aminotransferase